MLTAVLGDDGLTILSAVVPQLNGGASGTGGNALLSAEKGIPILSYLIPALGGTGEIPVSDLLNLGTDGLFGLANMSLFQGTLAPLGLRELQASLGVTVINGLSGTYPLLNSLLQGTPLISTRVGH